MATKTVVCPECGSEAVAGRFACGECGALVAAVGAARRRWTSTADAEPDEELPVDAGEDEIGPDEPALAAAEAVVETPTVEADSSATAPPADETIAEPVPAVLGLLEPVEDATVPDVVAEPAAPALDPEPAPIDAPAPPAAARPPAASAVPAWPPDGAERPVPRPVPRTPAGAYLSPSAAPPVVESRPVHQHPDPAAAAAAATATTAEGEADGVPRASLAETLGAFGITDDVPRRLIGGGAAIAGLGFLLPWASVLVGNGIGGSYFTRWGLAGPGHWIIVGALVALVLLALGSSRFSDVPVGPIAIVLAGVVLGVLWPYVFGASDRFVGVWLVLAGTLVLGVGGILDVRRHDPGEPPV